jgi:hypothetical protein
MGILDFELDKVPELGVATDGEHRIAITGAEGKLDKNQKPGLQVRFRVVDQENVKPLSTWLSFPADSDSKDEVNSKLRRIKTFRDAFKLTFKNAQQLAAMLDKDPKALNGSEAFAILNTQESDDYGEQNNIKRFVIPKA